MTEPGAAAAGEAARSTDVIRAASAAAAIGRSWRFCVWGDIWTRRDRRSVARAVWGDRATLGDSTREVPEK